jgi:hypothetical protein
MVSNNPEAEAQRRLEREAEAAKKRQENALPGWWQETQDPNQPAVARGSKDAVDAHVDTKTQTAKGEAVNDQDDCECSLGGKV